MAILTAVIRIVPYFYQDALTIIRCRLGKSIPVILCSAYGLCSHLKPSSILANQLHYLLVTIV